MKAAKENKIFINREISWLAFNKRVLELADDKMVPLAEQLKFAAIYASNLDEFFMVRVGSLYDQSLLKNNEAENKTGMTAAQQLDAIMPIVEQLQTCADTYTQALMEKLAAHHLRKTDFSALTKDEEHLWKKYFETELFPVLSPQIIDRHHPFPFLRNHEMYVGVLLKNKENEDTAVGVIPVSNQFERIITVNRDGETHFALVEELMLHFAPLVFGKKGLQASCLFRVTRNADITVDEAMFDHDIDYRDVMSELLKKRRKLAAVRLQVYDTQKNAREIVDFLCKKLLLPTNQVFYQTAPLDMSIGFKLAGRLAQAGDAKLQYPPQKPMAAPAGYSLTAHAAQEDVLMAYPYQSMRPFINMLAQAARDPEVLSIKMTLYRVASDSKIVQALIDAAENGKEVVAFVELRARFDEQNNIDWSKQMQEAGCTVIYGFADYKVHSKLTLITKKSGNKYSYISQIGTGNYNEKTAELYTDYSFISTNTQLGEEVAAVFNNMALERLTPHVQQLLVAPLCFKSVLLEEIDREISAKKAGNPAQVLIKCNSISDRELIVKLSEASCADVPVDMIVRGICCLKAGVPEQTENIRVRSLVGRYLEHGRIYAFGSGENLRIYICSGDFLTRNTQRRVEVGVRVTDPALAQKLYGILQLQLADNVNASEMQPDGSYCKVTPLKGQRSVDSQALAFDFFADGWAGRTVKEIPAAGSKQPWWKRWLPKK